MKHIALALVSFLGACQSLSMERVPRPEEIRETSRIAELLSECLEVTGVYSNLDVDALVFWCIPKAKSEAEFWQRLSAPAKAAGWTDRGRVGETERVFERIERAQSSQRLASSEECRVAWAGGRILVAYVQADHSGEPKPVRESSEGRFADKAIWPRFRSLVQKAG